MTIYKIVQEELKRYTFITDVKYERGYVYISYKVKDVVKTYYTTNMCISQIARLYRVSPVTISNLISKKGTYANRKDVDYRDERGSLPIKGRC